MPHHKTVDVAVVHYRDTVEPCWCAVIMFVIIITEYHCLIGCCTLVMLRMVYETAGMYLSSFNMNNA